MSYSTTLTICLLLCGSMISADDSSTLQQGMNNVAVDFPTSPQTSGVNRTSEVAASASGDDSITFTWFWKPMGPQRNKIESEPILKHFNFSGSGDEDLEYDDSETAHAVQDTSTWSAVTETVVDLTLNTTRTHKTLDKNRKRTEEKAYLMHLKNLRKTNWCFKETKVGRTNYKFKKTDMCCREQRECQARKQLDRGLHECSCDIYFHICLKKADSKMAKSIEKAYFNRNIVCYKKDSKGCVNEPCANVTYKWKIIPRHTQ